MKSLTLILCLLSFPSLALECFDPKDTYSDYNDFVKSDDINNIESEYYVLSYSWAPAHCKGTNDIKPGDKNYLQCSDPDKFGYILHGLWPQGKLEEVGNYPRACEGDYKQPIDREILNKYLCMTPSVWLLQHEYEYHGTCMHDESLESPDKYFETALMLHSKLNLPSERLPNNEASKAWFVNNNKLINLQSESIQYWNGGKEWQICFGNDFELMACPIKSQSSTVAAADKNCLIKGNISKTSKRKLYFTKDHPNYSGVKIHPSNGERCFSSEQEAIDSGWIKA